MKKIILLLLLISSSKSFCQWEQISESYMGESVWAFRMIGDRLFIGTRSNLLWSPNYGGSLYIDQSKNYFGVFSFEKIDDVYFCINGNDQKVGKSTDFGVTWEDTKFESKPGGYIWATKVLKDRLYIADINKGIQYTSDFGETWIFAGSKLVSSHIVYSMETMDDTLYVGGQGGLFRTTDLGLTWEKAGYDNRQINVVKVFEKKIYLGTWSDGLQVSEDFGKTWNKLEIDPTITNIRSIAFTKNPKNDSTIIIIGTEGNYPFGFETAGIYISLDMGKTWLNRSEGYVKYQTNFKPTPTTFYFVDKYVFVGSWQSYMYRVVLQDLIEGVGVEENSISRENEIYPNPASDKLTISNIPDGSVSYEIFDNLGQSVDSGLLNGDIDVSGLSSGIYFLKLNNQPPVMFIKL